MSEILTRRDVEGFLDAIDGNTRALARTALTWLNEYNEMAERVSSLQAQSCPRADLAYERKERRAAEAERDAVTVERDDLLRLKARSAQDEVFRIQHEITIAGDLVTIRVAPLRDPAIRALPLGVQLGLVVCDG